MEETNGSFYSHFCQGCLLCDNVAGDDPLQRTVAANHVRPPSRSSVNPLVPPSLIDITLSCFGIRGKMVVKQLCSRA
jgi:hypothetical protein